MRWLPNRLQSLKAQDVMTRNPVTLLETAPLASAVATLDERRITGAPVIDEHGKLVGVLSLWDVVRPPEAGAAASLSQTHHASRQIPERSAPNEGATVSQLMSRVVGTVPAESSLVDVARKMCHKHWHRVPVVTDDGQLLGIISTMDVLAALVNAFDESAKS